MLNRGQFTFYRSFWEARKVLPKKDRLPILEAIISYALDGIEPQSLSQSQLAFFSLVRPNLDSSRKKAESGKQGGKTGKANAKQNESKPQANANQLVSEKEKENENEEEKEIEDEKEKEQSASAALNSGKPFTAFWEAYPKKIDREGAWEAWKTLNPSPETAQQILASLDAWKKSSQWTEDGGRYVPDAARFIAKGYWKAPPLPSTGKKDIPKGASGQLGAAELEAIQRVLREG